MAHRQIQNWNGFMNIPLPPNIRKYQDLRYNGLWVVCKKTKSKTV